MPPLFFLRKSVCMLALAGLLVACASSTQIEVTQKLSESADAPYEKLLIVTLFSSFDARRYLEEEVVRELAERGVVGVPSTSMMNTKTPVAAQTFIDMVDKIEADAVLLTQLTSHDARHSERDARPELTYDYWPTHYFNVFAVELREYVEPPRLQTEHSLVLVTQVYSVKTEDPVWGMESRSIFVETQEDGLDYQIFVDEAHAIAMRLSRDRLIRR